MYLQINSFKLSLSFIVKIIFQITELTSFKKMSTGMLSGRVNRLPSTMYANTASKLGRWRSKKYSRRLASQYGRRFSGSPKIVSGCLSNAEAFVSYDWPLTLMRILSDGGKYTSSSSSSTGSRVSGNSSCDAGRHSRTSLEVQSAWSVVDIGLDEVGEYPGDRFGLISFGTIFRRGTLVVRAELLIDVVIVPGYKYISFTAVAVYLTIVLVHL